jgi:hypothetical protein
LGQASLLALLIFVVSFLATIGLLFFFSIRENRVTG